MAWAKNMAVGIRTGVPWVMCKGEDAPDFVVSSTLFFYIKNFPTRVVIQLFDF